MTDRNGRKAAGGWAGIFWLAIALGLAGSGAHSQDKPTFLGNDATTQQLNRALQLPPSVSPAETTHPGVRIRGAHRVAPEEPRQASASLTISFALGSWEILPESRGLLSNLAQAMAQEGLETDKFEIVGHTDATGTTVGNQALSLHRAVAVQVFLIRSGVSPERLLATGVGQNQPIDPSDPFAPQNRRVEIVNLGHKQD